MTIKMEVKKHKLEQLQNGDWKLTLTVHHEDMSMEIIQAAMGAPYGMVMVPIDYDNPVVNESLTTEQYANNAQCNPEKPVSKDSLHTEKPVVRDSRITEKSEGEKLRIRACALCNDKEFQEFMRLDTGDDGMWYEPSEKMATEHLYDVCGIDSRKSLAYIPRAQVKFKQLLEDFGKWTTSRKYADNLER